jgi:hypothetical protein
MGLLSKLFGSGSGSNLPIIGNAGIDTSSYIPEPTRSLLWVTNDILSKMASPFSFQIKISITPTGAESTVDDGKNFYGEPSLIWTRLPVKKNSDLEERPMYYPAYSRLSPEHRYQYLSWLADVTRPTNLSYVFLYFYGLERHLLIGNFDGAVKEILRLLKYHDKSSFRAYAEGSLVTASICKKRTDIFRDNTVDLGALSNRTLLVRKYLSQKLEPRDIMELASQVGFQNRRYIKLHPDLFEAELEKLVVAFEYRNGSLLDTISFDSLKYEESMVFGNLSLPDSVRHVKVPQLLSDERFCSVLCSLLEQAHGNLKTKYGGRIKSS